jgi:hypothetical protein
MTPFTVLCELWVARCDAIPVCPRYPVSLLDTSQASASASSVNLQTHASAPTEHMAADVRARLRQSAFLEERPERSRDTATTSPARVCTCVAYCTAVLDVRGSGSEPYDRRAWQHARTPALLALLSPDNGTERGCCQLSVPSSPGPLIGIVFVRM